MTSDRVFTINGSTAVRARQVSLADHFLHERRDLQEWIEEHPELLGEELLVVTEEYDRWTTAAGDRTADRLDILALDRTGRLVVAELKRHRAPNSVLVQALNYAAMASRFTVDDLVAAHARSSGSRPRDRPTATTRSAARGHASRSGPRSSPMPASGRRASCWSSRTSVRCSPTPRCSSSSARWTHASSGSVCTSSPTGRSR
jgi:hypothetical protein